MAGRSTGPGYRMDEHRNEGNSSNLHDLREKDWNSFFGDLHPGLLSSGLASERRKPKNRGEVMRMPGVEMGQYGILPETDPFMVVVCDLCKAAVKPQGLRKHVHRHTDPATALASLITPCSVSVNALKFDPKGDNSNSSTSSVYNMVGFETSSSSSSNQLATDVATSFVQDFGGDSGNGLASIVTLSAGTSSSATAAAAATTPTNGNATMSVKSKSGGGGGKPGSLKIKLSKSGLKTHATISGMQSSSNSSSSSSIASSSITAPQESGLALSTSSSGGAGIGTGVLEALPLPANALPPPPPSSETKKPVATEPGKKISVKEREYEPNKHCGVILVATGKHCTRTLTCKSHALSLRRQVQGRSLPFDKLLSDHRAMRALAAGKPIPGSVSSASSSSSAASSLSSTSHLRHGGGDSRSDRSSHRHSHHHNHHQHHSEQPESSGGKGLRLKRELSQIGDSFNEHKMDRTDPPPAKKMQLERKGNEIIGPSSSMEDVWNGGGGGGEEMLIKSEPVDEEPFRVVLSHHQQHKQRHHNNNNNHSHQKQPRQQQQQLLDNGQQQFKIEPFHENGFELHGSPQLVASSNGGYFIKSEPQHLEGLAEDDLNAADGEESQTAAALVPSIVTVSLTMLGNVMYVNGRNCILEAAPDSGKEEQAPALVEIPGMKGMHVESVDGASGEKRRYLTLSAGRQQRAINRLRLNVLRTDEETLPAGYARGLTGAGAAANDFAGIDTWYSQIPKPSYVNCFKLCKLGTSSAVLSKRYLNIRKSLIMNMASAHSQGGSPSVAGGASAVGQFALNRSNSQSAGNSPSSGRGANSNSGGGGGGSGGYGVEKVNFSAERIKV